MSDGAYDGTYHNPGGFTADGHGDVSTITGQQCLLQDLIHHLLTPKGTLIAHPEYGSDFTQFIGKKSTHENISRAVIELERTFLSDPRVIGVSDTKISVFGDRVHIQCYIDTTMSRIEWKHIL